MAIVLSPSLATILRAETSQYNQVRALDTALTTNKRVKAKYAPAGTAQSNVWATGTLFRDAALIGAFTFADADITGYGFTSNLTTCTAVDLTTNVAVLRIEGGGHWLEGTFGLPGSGADFIFPVNPTATNSIAIAGTLRLRGNSKLPQGIPDTIYPTVSLAVASATVTQEGLFGLTASPNDNAGVARVEFYRDDILLHTKTTAPWTYSDNLKYLNKGSRSYYVKVYDTSNNVTTSSAQVVSVEIPPPVETGPETAVGAELTTVTIENTSATTQSGQLTTFAQVFKVGSLPATDASVELVAPDNTVIPCQFDARAFHGDGSVRHGVISAVLPSLAAATPTTFSVRRKLATASTPATVSEFTDLDSVVTINEGGTVYTVSLATLLAGTKTTWLSGDVVTEWEVAGIPKTSGGTEHADLHVRFNVRGYKGQNKARVDISVENTWAWNPSPRDVTYDVNITVGGTQVYTQSALVHHPRARWRKIFWWNTTEPEVFIAHNIDYLIGTKAVPNYDRTVVPSATKATEYYNNTVTNGGPMKPGTARPGMSGGGGRPDMGILPGWTALALISMNKDAVRAMLNQGSLSGSWSMHFRDKNTGRVLSFNDWPHFSLTGSTGDNVNPATGLSEKAPTIVSNTNTNGADIAHHPDQAFVPYLLTGDLYYLEELQFWAQYCVINQNSHPTIRGGAKGLIRMEQTRGMAWSLRSIAHAGYISPPGTKKTEYEYMLQQNIDWFDTRYTNNTADDTKLGAIIHEGGASTIGYEVIKATAEKNGIAPWMDDHFLSAIGRALELGYTAAAPLFSWKSKFTVSRLYGDPGFCWIQAASFVLRVRDGGPSTPIYTTMREVYENTFSPDCIAAKANGCATQEMADAWGRIGEWTHPNGVQERASFDGVSNPIVGDMDGYSDSDTGYPSNLQPAVAYCATHGATNGQNAWEVFDGRTVKPDYGNSPQFAIVPRT